MEESKHIDPSLIRNMFSFEEFLLFVENLVKNKKTSGPDQSPKLLDFTKLNSFRLKRIAKNIEIETETKKSFKKLEAPMHWIVLVEAWCGDVSQNIPYIHALSELSDNISLNLILKHENPEIMSMFLTNGAESIPKLICLDPETNQVAGTWGPRPFAAQQLLLDYKKNPDRPKSEVLEDIQKWYHKDKGLTIQREFVQNLKEWEIRLSSKLSA